MKKLFVALLALGSISAFASEKYVCDGVFNNQKALVTISVQKNNKVKVDFVQNNVKSSFNGGIVRELNTSFIFMTLNKDESMMLGGEFKRDSQSIEFGISFPETGVLGPEGKANKCRKMI